ncbi:hypothetical protein COHCIP112018_01300 [Cohnella sp. JJ-181]|nr:hypothetical protein COHCIP112018_01300 [Cohnella sp. JJ-181]
MKPGNRRSVRTVLNLAKTFYLGRFWEMREAIACNRLLTTTPF